MAVRVMPDAMSDLVGDIFVAAGLSREEADRIGRSLVSANLAGHDSHGVVRVPRYLEWLGEGAVHAGRSVTVVRETPVIAVLDAQFGFGQTAAPQATAIGIDKCKSSGLSAVALRNSGHVGRVGEWAEMAADAGLVSIHHVNAPASLLVAPFGAAEARYSTAPYAVGIPRPDGQHIILDFATSVVAEGKVLVASQGGKPLPDDALVSGDGVIGGDPRFLYGDYAPDGARDYRNGRGAIRAMGEHKGSGLAFMVELLGGALTGTGAPKENRPWANGMLSLFIDPAVIDPEGFFPGEVSRYVDYFKTARPIDPAGEVLHPGEPELRRRADRSANGFEIPAPTWAAIRTAGMAQGVPAERIDGVATTG